MRIALVQQHATQQKEEDVKRVLAAFAEAAGQGAELVCYAELAFEPFYPQRPAGFGAAGWPSLFPAPSRRVSDAERRSSV